MIFTEPRHKHRAQFFSDQVQIYPSIFVINYSTISAHVTC